MLNISNALCFTPVPEHVKVEAGTSLIEILAGECIYNVYITSVHASPINVSVGTRIR